MLHAYCKQVGNNKQKYFTTARAYTDGMRKTTRLKSGWGFGQKNSPLSIARFLMLWGYVCSESVKCDDCLPQTLGDELTLSLAVTLNQD